jgi:diacylglycerol O-acyltransferase
MVPPTRDPAQQTATSSTAHSMSPLDRGFLAYGERNPQVALGIGAVILFRGSPPSLHEVREHLRDRCSQIPSLNRRLTGATWRRAAWVPATPLDLTVHVRERMAAEEQGGEGLRKVINELLPERFQGPFPPWRCWLIHGYSREEFALLYLGHHALHDGLTLRHIAEAVFNAAPEAQPMPPSLPLAQKPTLRAAIRGMANNMRSLIPPAPPVGRTDFTNRRLLSWDLTSGMELGGIARRHNATVNDVFLAGITGVLREWPESPWRELSSHRRTVYTFIPMNTRNSGVVDQIGNRLSGYRMPLPCGEPNPVKRLEIISKLSREGVRRGHQDFERFSLFGPKWLGQFAVGRSMSARYAQVFTTSVPISGLGLALAGRPVSAMIPIAHLPTGHCFTAAMFFSRDQSCIAFAADSCLDSADELPTRWLASIEELKHA